MKKTLFLMLIILVALSSLISAKGMQVGGAIGLYLPTGDAGDVFDPSIGLNGLFLYDWKEKMQLEGQIGFWMLSNGTDYKGFSARYIPILAGIRYFQSPQLHFDGGAGIYAWSFEWDLADYGWGLGKYSDSGSDIGIYGGAGYLLNNKIDLNARIHFPDFDDFFLGVTVGYLFDIQ